MVKSLQALGAAAPSQAAAAKLGGWNVVARISVARNASREASVKGSNTSGLTVIENLSHSARCSLRW